MKYSCAKIHQIIKTPKFVWPPNKKSNCLTVKKEEGISLKSKKIAKSRIYRSLYFMWEKYQPLNVEFDINYSVSLECSVLDWSERDCIQLRANMHMQQTKALISTQANCNRFDILNSLASKQMVLLFIWFCVAIQ